MPSWGIPHFSVEELEEADGAVARRGASGRVVEPFFRTMSRGEDDLDHYHRPLENAISALTKAIDLENDEFKKSDLLRQRAQLFHSLQNSQTALEGLENSVSLNPSNPISWLQIAEFHQARNDWNSVNQAVRHSLTVQTPPPGKVAQTALQIAANSSQFFENKIKQNQRQVRNIAGDFLGCALYHALAALCA